MVSAETTMNGAPPSRWQDMGLRDLKKEAALYGIGIEGKDRYAILNDLETYRKEKELERLQQECVSQGLSTEGSIQDLKLRLKAADRGSEAVTDWHRKGYLASAYAINGLGIVALIISLPHVAGAINDLMACGMFFAYLLAVIIDIGIGGLKAVDTFKHKFELGKLLPIVWFVMIICIIMSALLNAHQFLAHVTTAGGGTLSQVLAVVMAIFVPCFAFSMFFIGTNMLVKCTERKAGEDLTPVQKLERLRMYIQDIDKWIEKIPVT